MLKTGDVEVWANAVRPRQSKVAAQTDLVIGLSYLTACGAGFNLPAKPEAKQGSVRRECRRQQRRIDNPSDPEGTPNNLPHTSLQRQLVDTKHRIAPPAGLLIRRLRGG